MEKLIESIFERLRNEVPELRFIDIDLGQLQLEQPPIDWPCALVDVANVDYKGGNMQTAETVLNITLGFLVYGPSNTGAAPELRQQAMQHYEIVRKVAETLHGFSPAGFAPLNRVSLVRGNETYPRHFTLSFRTQHTERIAP